MGKGDKDDIEDFFAEFDKQRKDNKHVQTSRCSSSVHAGSAFEAREPVISKKTLYDKEDRVYMTDRNIFKVLCMCVLVIAIMGACIFATVFILKESIIIPLGVSIVVAVLLLMFIYVTMIRSIYKAIPANLVVYFLYAQVFCCVITIDEEVIGDHIWLFGIIVLIGSSVLIFIATAIDVIFLSPYMLYYYLGSFAGLFLGVGIITGGVIEFGVLNFQLLVSDPVCIRGICMAISGLSLLFLKILFYKDFKGYIEDNFKFI